jgi:hypothetical protein
MQWDVFISHATEDKDEVARPLAQALHNAGLRVWLDENELQLGDSLRAKIDHGLANARAPRWSPGIYRFRSSRRGQHASSRNSSLEIQTISPITW